MFAGDHGVHAQGVTPWPQEVTAQMVANFLAGGAVINAFARQVGATVTVVDVAVAAPLVPVDGLVVARVRPGTGDITEGPALSRDEAQAAVEVGIQTAYALLERGAGILVAGDMGIANTTPAAALIAAFTGATPERVTGRGTGIDDKMLARKTAVVRAALNRVPGVHQASVSLRRQSRLQTITASSALVKDVDQAQYDHSGPCVEALESGVEVSWRWSPGTVPSSRARRWRWPTSA